MKPAVKPIRVGSRGIGPGRPCFIIAEAGSNHDGRLSQALELIDAAAHAKADAVKFQLFKASKLYPPTAGESDYLQRKQSIFEIIRAMELSGEWLAALKRRCDERDILFLASAFDEESADQLAASVPAMKIASYELTHLPLLEHVAKLKKPVLMSTGACELSDVDRSVAVLKRSRVQLVLFQCTARYPAPPKSLHLRTIPELARRYGVPVGFSDHSADPYTAPIAAVALGACAIEKHFTLSREGAGPDHRFSIEPGELAELVRRVRDAEASLGSAKKAVDPEERELYHFARRSIFTARAIHKGELLSQQNLSVLRNGKLKPGLAPSFWKDVLGRRAKRDLPAYQGLQKADVAAGPRVAPIHLRPVRDRDSKLLFRWRGDPTVIQNSLGGRKISWPEHREWFGKLLVSQNRRQWILETDAGTPVGQVRVDWEKEGHGSIHVGIDKRQRGKGYAVSGISAAVDRAVQEWSLTRIRAQILSHNEPSRRAFEKAGFRRDGADGQVETWFWEKDGDS